MNGSTYPFQIFGNGWEAVTPQDGDLPHKGDTVVGNDVWIGYDAPCHWPAPAASEQARPQRVQGPSDAGSNTANTMALTVPRS